MRGLAVALLASVVGGCAVAPYDPARVTFDGLAPDAAFRRCLDVVRVWFPNVEADAAAFRMQSDWLTVDDSGRPARRRLSLFRDGPDAIGFVVEVSYLEFDWLGEPLWTTPRGHSRWERELEAALRQALAAG